MHHGIHQGKLTEFWIRIYMRHSGHSEARKNPYKKTRERREKNRGNLGRNQAEKITIRKYIHLIYR